jgi:hypothetical protein
MRCFHNLLKTEAILSVHVAGLKLNLSPPWWVQSIYLDLVKDTGVLWSPKLTLYFNIADLSGCSSLCQQCFLTLVSIEQPAMPAVDLVTFTWNPAYPSVFNSKSSSTGCRKLESVLAGMLTDLILCLDSNLLIWLNVDPTQGRKARESNLCGMEQPSQEG